MSRRRLTFLLLSALATGSVAGWQASKATVASKRSPQNVTSFDNGDVGCKVKQSQLGTQDDVLFYIRSESIRADVASRNDGSDSRFISLGIGLDTSCNVYYSAEEGLAPSVRECQVSIAGYTYVDFNNDGLWDLRVKTSRTTGEARIIECDVWRGNTWMAVNNRRNILKEPQTIKLSGDVVQFHTESGAWMTEKEIGEASAI